MAHKQAQPYSGKNPVPVVTTKLTSLVSPERATEAKAQQLQDASARDEQMKTQKTASRLSKGHVVHGVKDPTTGEELDICNADEGLDERSQGNNVLHLKFPPPDWKQHRDHVLSITNSAVIYICLSFIIFFALSTAFSDWRYRVLCAVPSVFVSYSSLFWVNKASETDFEQRVWHAERMRGLVAGSDVDGDGSVANKERVKESAEWVNALVRGLWPTINSDLFRSLVDMLEDIMQSSVPAFIHSVRIPDMGLGSNAGRITAIRSLPDARSREGGDSLAGLGIDTGSVTPEDRDALDEDHINCEVSFAYQGVPSGRSAQEKAQNIHFMVEFFLGVKNLWGFRVPVWVEVTGAVGTARARLQLIPDPPFVKTTLITLMGLPRITISVVPMNRALPNVMNLPFISGFISSAIDTAAAEYVAPKSMTLDLQRLISGDAIKKDTEAIGIVVVHIHHATGIKKMDTTGASDPYVTLTYSRLEKPLYSTRIIKCDLNPVFEETAVLLVDVNTVGLREKISFQLWDSDRLSVDDMIGFAEIDLVDLIRHRGTPIRRVSPLSPDSRTRPGSLEYTVGYYGKLPPNKALSKDGADPSIPTDLRGVEELKDTKSVALNEVEAAVLVTPPDPMWPSGLLSMQVHEIRDLAVRRMGKERKGGSREGEKGQDAGEETAEEDEGLPSSYCTLSLNDELLYETRVKPITSSPMFNAGTERFVRDWRTAHVAVTVKDSRMRENDAILGTVFLKLSDIFVNASEVTCFYSLEKGLGTGRIRISLLFRPVEAKLPPNLLGFDTGTLDIRSVSVHDTREDLSRCEVRLKTTTSKAEEKISYKAINRDPDSTALAWTPDSGTELPVRQRYAAALLVSFRDKSKSGFKSSGGRKGLVVLWLRDIVDRAEGVPVECALWRARGGGSDYSRLKRNYVPPDGDLSCWDSDREGVECVGRVRLDLVFWPGIAEKHYEMLDGHGARDRSSWDEYDRQRTGGLREEVGKMTVPTRAPAGEHRSMEGQDAREVGEERNPYEEPDTAHAEGPVDTSRDNDQKAHEGTEKHAVNIAVSADKVQVMESESPEGSNTAADGRYLSSHADHDGHDSGCDKDDTGPKRGLVGKIKDWRQHEKELHRDHRGVMQAKPMRTAKWIKDSVKDGVHNAKDRFKMKPRHPDVETEVKG